MPLTLVACCVFVVVVVSMLEDILERLAWGVLASGPLLSFLAVAHGRGASFNVLAQLTGMGAASGNLDPPMVVGFLLRWILIYVVALGTGLAYRVALPQRTKLLAVSAVGCAAFVLGRWLPE
jgi:hypothetical protein